MFQKLLAFLLFAAMFPGGYLAWQESRERIRLEREYARLVKLTGDLPITDPSKIHVLALPTDDPRVFSWRLYLPPNYAQVWTSKNSGSSSSARPDAIDCVMMVRFRENEEGRLEVYKRTSNASGLTSLGDVPLAAFLRTRWDQLRVEQLGAEGLTVIEPDDATVLLRLSLTDAMEAEARKTLPPSSVFELPVLYELTLGQKKPKP